MLPELEVIEDMSIETLKDTNFKKTKEEWIQLLICAMATDPTSLEEMPNKIVSRYAVDNSDCPITEYQIRTIALVIQQAREVCRYSSEKGDPYALEKDS